MVPRLIHQTARTAELPAKWRGFQRKLRSLHPDWTYRLWTDADNLAFAQAEYPDFAGVYARLPKNIMRADVIRYLLMDRLGGLYIDLDYEMLKPFDLTDHACVLPLEDAGEPAKRETRIANSLLASTPGHPFFRAVLDELMTNPPLDRDADVLSATGPLFVSRVLRRIGRDRLDVLTPAPELFNPPTPRNPRERRRIIDAGVAYGIHHCDGTWREWTLRQRIRNRVSWLVHQLR